MIIDSLAGIPLPGVLDIKSEKKAGLDVVRPIEGTGGSSESDLDIQRDKAAKHRATREKPEAETKVEEYNAKGKPISNYLQPDEASLNNPSISLEI